MSKFISATCENKAVKIGELTVTANILSQGTKASSGVALLDAEDLTYITSNASDIKDLIVSLGAIIDQIVLITTSLDAVTTTPGSSAAAISQLSTLKTQLDLTKDNLK